MGAAVAASERGEAHGGDGDGGAAVRRARGKARESERVGNGWSSEVASVFTPLRPDRLGQCRRMPTMQRAWPMADQPLMARRPPV